VTPAGHCHCHSATGLLPLGAGNPTWNPSQWTGLTGILQLSSHPTRRCPFSIGPWNFFPSLLLVLATCKHRIRRSSRWTEQHHELPRRASNRRPIQQDRLHFRHASIAPSANSPRFPCVRTSSRAPSAARPVFCGHHFAIHIHIHIRLDRASRHDSIAQLPSWLVTKRRTGCCPQPHTRLNSKRVRS
jgi:hypothetical protein